MDDRPEAALLLMLERATVAFCSNDPVCNMPQISISEAARLTGKPRSTIHRHLKNGTLSKGKDGQGRPVIDVAELERVYGALQQMGMPQTGATRQSAAPGWDRADLIELEALRRENALLLNERDDLRRRLDLEGEERRRLTALLTDRRQPEAAPVAPTKPAEGRLSRAWSILRGKA